MVNLLEVEDQSSTVVTGKILIAGLPSIALIDSGSTLSFIAAKFAKKLPVRLSAHN
ncbi:hypothetical protein F511_28797 [Dorcoceras hygrometricum]|uniref:Uncharacterized protein n=1 Tax=Dorcoceras hygrometricum TaxID=472368 RepID=A0A2Z7AUM5_9LAMI|nr:hypothetical protein F511_28797 [Dorcoceras hygrometricum]